MFRSSTIIWELALNLAKFIFMLNHSVKLRHYLLYGCVAACHGMVFVLHAVQNAQHATHTPVSKGLLLHTIIASQPSRKFPLSLTSRLIAAFMTASQ
jgi:hypothetical protein